MNHPSSLLVILDLDHTLFYSSWDPLDRPADFRIGRYHTYKRPGVEAFLRQIASDSRFTMAVWTGHSEDYIATGVMNLSIQKDSLLALFSRDHCDCIRVRPEMGIGKDERYIKDLRVLERVTGWPVERMIAIDNDPGYYMRQRSNLLAVEPYYGTRERQKEVFPALLHELARLHAFPNVRKVEKRHWYENYLKTRA
jgi:hypothetical protein